MQLKRRYAYSRNEPMSVQDAVSAELDGSDYYRGSAETTSATANNTAEFVARLTQELVDAQLLPKEAVLRLLAGYEEAADGG